MKRYIAKLWKGIKSPRTAWGVLKYKYAVRFYSPQRLCDFLYRKTFGHSINWEHPEDLNQWIAWLQFNTDTTLWSTLADKYRMHDYLKQKGYGELLVPILAKWESADQIDISDLPDGFVLKCNNGSGDVMVVNDKRKVDVREIRQYFNAQMSRQFGRETAEPHYLRIQPLIIAEKLLDVTKQSTASASLIDYKFWCFNGTVKGLFVCSDRTKNGYSTEMYDLNWNRISDDNIIHDDQTSSSPTGINPPLSFETMKKVAQELSKGMPEVRLDFYEVDGKPYLGEITLTAACGRMTHYTPKSLTEMGKLCGEAVRELTDSGQLKFAKPNSLRGGQL